jgi:fucose 4-O-acetylase-like acetyltransferase
LLERTLVIRIALTGALIAAGAFAASFFPSPYAHSEFWTSSPSYFLLRTGALTALIGVAYAWERRPWGKGRFSPLQQLGRTSLFIYWIHVEMIYGLAVRPLHKSMSFPAAALAIVAFFAFMLVCSIAKERLALRFKRD